MSRGLGPLASEVKSHRLGGGFFLLEWIGLIFA